MSREGRARWGFNEHFIIGKQDNPMLDRWRLIQTPLGGIYVHFIYREDLDPVPHDHPWAFASLVLRGGYTEELHHSPGSGDFEWVTHRAGRLHKFPLHWAHRIVRVAPGTVTLVFVGRKVRSWGFYDGPQWIDYRDRPPQPGRDRAGHSRAVASRGRVLRASRALLPPARRARAHVRGMA